MTTRVALTVLVPAWLPVTWTLFPTATLGDFTPFSLYLVVIPPTFTLIVTVVVAFAVWEVANAGIHRHLSRVEQGDKAATPTLPCAIA